MIGVRTRASPLQAAETFTHLYPLSVGSADEGHGPRVKKYQVRLASYSLFDPFFTMAPESQNDLSSLPAVLSDPSAVRSWLAKNHPKQLGT
jgi:hypothetical protein